MRMNPIPVASRAFPDIDRAQRSDAALAWIRRSIAATGGRGSAHSYSPFWGWSKAYPETTGYLIPTLLRYSAIKQDHSLKVLAEECRNWLESVQLPAGAFAGGLAGNRHPSVFNTAMILFGLLEAPSGGALERAARWLLDTLDPDEVWRQAAYVPGFVPSYYTYAVWALLEADKVLHWPEIPERMRAALRFYARRFQSDGTLADWGFQPGRTAFTHTIAYTLQGLLESACLLDEPEILAQTVRSAEQLQSVYENRGRIAGRYSSGWRGDYSFRCLSGNAQLSVLYFRLAAINGSHKFRETGRSILMETLPFQKLGKHPNTSGALPGSAPFWGPYLRFRYPNWGVKFFLDAMAEEG